MYHPAPMSDDSINWAAQDWEDLMPRLILLAVLRLSRLVLLADYKGQTARESEAQDFVDAAISKTLSGRSAWDPDDRTLFEHLARIVVSDITDQAGPASSPLAGAVTGGGERANDGAGGSPDPQQESWRSERRSLLDHLYDKSEKLGEMASLMLLENCLETGELANALEVVPQEITNLRRRMKREVRDYIAGHQT